MRCDSKGNAVRLKHVKTVRKTNGATFHYLAVPGCKLVRLPDGAKDTPAFLMAYAAALAGATPTQTRPASGTIAAAIIDYQTSRAFGDLAATTRAYRHRHLSRIAEKWGSARLKDLRADHIEADISLLSPHPANHRLKAWRGFLGWAKETRQIAADPSAGIAKRSAPKSDGFAPWTADDIQKFRDHWPIGTSQRLAMELVYWSAARASDAVRLGPGMVTRDGWLTFRQSKTGGEVSVPFSRSLPAFAVGMQPDLDLLHAAIAATPRHMTWLVTVFGAARSVKAFSAWFSGAATDAGVPGKSAHGLRKARAEAMAEAGATAHQIAAWTGHETLAEVQRYSKSADRKRILSGPDMEQNLQPPETITGNRNKNL